HQDCQSLALLSACTTSCRQVGDTGGMHQHESCPAQTLIPLPGGLYGSTMCGGSCSRAAQGLLPDLQINQLKLFSVVERLCMWVRSALKTMTEHSGQPDPAEVRQRTLTEHSQQIQSHGTTLRTLLDRQQQTNQQLDQMASLL
ncbi:hypothetical protein ILYODFUR_038980, partial [Ilyodon furcidens]